MDEVTVTTTPVDLGAALAGGPVGEEGSFRLQNRGPNTIYRLVADTAPTPASVRGWRHPVGDVTVVTLIHPDAISSKTWVWTSQGSADLVVEPQPAT